MCVLNWKIPAGASEHAGHLCFVHGQGRALGECIEHVSGGDGGKEVESP